MSAFDLGALILISSPEESDDENEAVLNLGLALRCLCGGDCCVLERPKAPVWSSPYLGSTGELRTLADRVNPAP
jgi:hypothetical protein